MRILVIRFSALGDILLLTGPLRELKKQRPDIEVHLLTSMEGQELLQNSVDIDRLITLPKGSPWYQVARTYLNLPRYDFIFDLQAKPKSYAIRLFARSKIIRYDKQAKQRRSFVKNRKYRDKLSHHVVEKYYHALKTGLHLKDRDRESLRPVHFVKPLVFNDKKFDFSKALLLHPYASQKNKVWPYAEEFLKKMDTLGIPTVVVGAESDAPLSYQSDTCLNLTNQTSLNETLAIMASVKTVITTDSGPLHMSVALNKPTIALFGPTTRELGFYPDFQGVTVLEKDLECRPCHIHGGNICPLGHHRCLKDITVDEVLTCITSTHST